MRMIHWYTRLTKNLMGDMRDMYAFFLEMEDGKDQYVTEYSGLQRSLI